MKYKFLPFVFLALLLAPISAKDAHIILEEYVTSAEAITICVVEKDNGDGTVTVSVKEVLKGKLGKTEIIRGETERCVVAGPVSRFMKVKNTYLVFLFKDNTVGRLGGIMAIEEDKTLHIPNIGGFTGTTLNKELHRHTLPVNEAKEQIKAILQKSSK